MWIMSTVSQSWLMGYQCLFSNWIHIQNESCFGLDQHSELKFNGASHSDKFDSTKCHPTRKHYFGSEHTSVCSFALRLRVQIVYKQRIPICSSLVWRDYLSNPRPPAFEANKLRRDYWFIICIINKYGKINTSANVYYDTLYQSVYFIDRTHHGYRSAFGSDSNDRQSGTYLPFNSDDADVYYKDPYMKWENMWSFEMDR